MTAATGAWPAEPRRVVVTGMGMLTRARQRCRVVLGRPASPAAPASGRSSRSTRRGSTRKIAGEVRDFDASDVLDRKDMRRTDRYIQFGLVATREAMDQAGPARRGSRARRPSGPG